MYYICVCLYVNARGMLYTVSNHVYANVINTTWCFYYSTHRPQFGGNYCVGESREFSTCNTEVLTHVQENNMHKYNYTISKYSYTLLQGYVKIYK